MKKAIVIHADILGFKAIIENAENDENNETFEKLKSALNESVGILNMFRKLELVGKIELNYKLFSDNLYASFSYNENDSKTFSNALFAALLFSRSYFSNMLSNKILIRGAISFGSDYSDDTMIFSLGLVRAYELETKKAIFPRIIIDNELVDFLKAGIMVPSDLFITVLDNSILKDLEGIYFINPNGLAADFNAEIEDVSGKQLDKIFMANQIEFVRQELFDLLQNPIAEGKIIQKYEWLLDLLIWNFGDRKIPALNKFEKLNVLNK